jgi:cbb3-type cytochrome oxidase subunit 3
MIVGLIEFLMTAGLVLLFVLFIAVPSWRDGRKAREERERGRPDV